MPALAIPFAPATTSTLAAAPATTSTLAAAIDLAATPRLLTPGAPAPLNKSARALHGVSGHIHGTDVSAGFEKGWVEVVDLNLQAAAPGTQEAMDAAIEQFRRGNVDFVFRGDYTGVNPDDPSDTWDLRSAYIENENTSYPLFHYLLSNIITVVS